MHRAAGSRRVVELHGTSREVMCIGVAPRLGTPSGCGFRAPHRWAFGVIDAGIADPACPTCGGIVKLATVSFGQNLFPGDLQAAAQLVGAADMVLAVSSSLQVYPAADLPATAVRTGVPLAIVNDEPTPLDAAATVVARGRAGVVLPPAVAAALTTIADQGAPVL
ncbi:MAG: SIR2 family NAD-dependent protein deacylase [Egibacteraceae bacterium]